MTEKVRNNARVIVPDPKSPGSWRPVVDTAVEEVQTWRRKCGCLRTSDKLKNILDRFPTPPPPTPVPAFAALERTLNTSCNYCMSGRLAFDKYDYIAERKINGRRSRSWQLVAELVQLVQLSVTATALALYYLIYCYMQLVYYTLRSALYFHNADGPMKITIGVVTVTSLVVGFNLMLRMERLLGIIY